MTRGMRMPFGKFKGQSIDDIELPYRLWLLTIDLLGWPLLREEIEKRREAWRSDEVKWICTKSKSGSDPDCTQELGPPEY